MSEHLDGLDADLAHASEEITRLREYNAQLECAVETLRSENELYAAEMSDARKAGFHTAQELFAAYTEAKKYHEGYREGVEENMAVFPALAGMNRCHGSPLCQYRCVPRARGDEPQ